MSLRGRIRRLYEADAPWPRRFRAALTIFDVATVGYFLFTATAEMGVAILAADIAIGIVVGADLAARFVIAGNRARFFLNLANLADIVVLISLAAPIVAGSNLAFLRVLRLLRLVRSYRLAHEIDRAFRSVSINSRVSLAAANLVVFVFVVTSLVWVWEHDRNPALNTYVDAAYFTITTLTTTGYGDIVLTDRIGRIMTIFIMVFGVGFFLNLIQAIYRPAKIEQPCPNCGLSLHDRDASHCKHCGTVIYIETEGDT